MFAVTPKYDCPHVATGFVLRPVTEKEVEDLAKSPCTGCGDDSENWICLTCYHVCCSRYVQSHMVHHFESTNHPIVVSLSDLSFWCYKCDSYIVSNELNPCKNALYKAKFGEAPPQVFEERVTEHRKNNAIADRIAETRTFYPPPTPIALPELPGKTIQGTSHSSQAEIQEFEDDEEVIDAKVKELADFIRASKHAVVFTGAGISTSASIPDYRGPKGVWTMRDRGQKVDWAKTKTIADAEPTLVHRSLCKLMDEGLCKYVVSTNVDNLHVRSGLQMTEQVAELHGNCFVEFCVSCKRQYLRPFDVTSNRLIDHAYVTPETRALLVHLTGRTCDDCGGALRDNIVHFGENLLTDQLERAVFHSEKCDLALVMGTSMRVRPACNLPEDSYERNGGHLVIINLQRTPYDKFCALRFWARTDVVMDKLMAELGLTVPEYDPSVWTQKNSSFCPTSEGDGDPSSSSSSSSSP